MTKEAKLSAAMRIVPEWRKYDDEIKGLMARVRRGLYQASDHDQVIRFFILFFRSIHFYTNIIKRNKLRVCL